MARICAYLAVAVGCVNHALARPLAYPEGIKPGDVISGNAGEFWRYKHVLIKPPDDEDRMEALRMSEDVKCAVCETILHRLMKRVESNAEDHIMDALDGEPDEILELTGDDQEDRVNRNRRGCNKHFKDEVLLRGFAVKPCPPITLSDPDGSPEDPPKPPKSHCLENSGGAVDTRSADTYSPRSEAVFYACENTIARHGHEVASLLAENIESGGDVTDAIKDVCLQAAACDGQRDRKAKMQRKGRKEKSTAKKKKPKANEEEASMWDIMNEQREEEKKGKKRRRKRKASHVEL